MRVTNSMLANTVTGDLSASLERLQKYQAQVSSGKRIARASDDPLGTGRSLSLRSSKAEAEQYAKNVDLARTQLNAADASLSSITKILQDAKQTGLSGASSTLFPNQREQLTIQVQAQIDSVLREINAKPGGTYLYSGHRTEVPPVALNPAGTPPYAYQGDDGAVSIPVSDTSAVRTNLTARQVLNLGGANDPALPDVLSTLTGLRDSLASGDLGGIQDRLKEVERHTGNVVSLRGAMGARGHELELYADRLEDTKLSLDEWISDEENVDMTEALTNLQAEQNVYQASLIATSRIIQPSLADFLR
jgi:flagellar hook-associated protein 3 FlgL